MSNEVGLRLKELRRKLNMTQPQLGEKMGIKATTLAKHEKGICFPTGKMLNILASQYNVSMDYLVCGRGTLFYEDKDNTDSIHPKNIMSGDKELEELISLVSSMSWVRHALLSYFQRFKLENRELIQKELEKEPGIHHPEFTI
jgi:transcriptional regulator with XRE-family HTH domain